MKIVITRKLPIDVAEEFSGFNLEANPADEPLSPMRLRQLVSDATGLLCMRDDKIDRSIIEYASQLKVIANYSIGLDNIDLVAAEERGIKVFNTPKVLTNATAELGFSLILACARRLIEADKLMRTKIFPVWSSSLILGTELNGKTLGIYGMGDIGKAVAKIALGFGMKVAYHNRRKIIKLDKGISARYVDFETLLSKSDFILISAPLTNETKHRFTRKEFEKMKPTASLVNIGKGAIVDEADLTAALKTRRIRSAGLDVYEFEPLVSEELKSLQNVVLTPHIGSATIEAREAMVKICSENILSVIRG